MNLGKNLALHKWEIFSKATSKLMFTYWGKEAALVLTLTHWWNQLLAQYYSTCSFSTQRQCEISKKPLVSDKAAHHVAGCESGVTYAAMKAGT